MKIEKQWKDVQVKELAEEDCYDNVEVDGDRGTITFETCDCANCELCDECIAECSYATGTVS